MRSNHNFVEPKERFRERGNCPVAYYLEEVIIIWRRFHGISQRENIQFIIGSKKGTSSEGLTLFINNNLGNL